MSSPSLASSISKMFSGTLVSRILGQVRLIVLVAAIGATGQADAFTVANTLPNTIYNLLAGGVLNAILVPQIVRAMRRKDGDEYVNRLLTLSGALLFGATLLLTAGSALLVTLYASQMAPEWFALAVAFAFWCIPQVFFYGLYTLLGNVLNARGSFGPYMWAPVVNNVIAIAGLFIYIGVFGLASSGSGTNHADWTGTRIALLAGFATLGVVCQALVLIVPLRRSGFRFRPTWGFRGHGLGGASWMAMWTFGALLIGQVGYLMLTNVASSANGAAAGVDVFVPTNMAYASAFAIFMLPQSLITTSLVTALFTRMSAHAAARDGDAVRADMSFGLRVVGVFTVFAAAALTVLAIPVVQAVIPTAQPDAAVGFAAVLVALSIGIPAQGVWTIDQRVSYAYEDARTLFHIQIPMALVIVVGGFLSFLAPPQWWVPIVAGASSLSMYVGGVVGYLALRKKLPSLDGARVLRTYLRLTIAVTPASVVGWVVLHYWGPVSGVGVGLGPFLTAVVKLLVIGSLMALIYFGLLRYLKVGEVDEILDPAVRLLRKLRTPSRAAAAPAPRMGGDGDDNGEDPDVNSLRAGSRIAGRFRLESGVRTTASGARLWSGRDEVLDRPVTILVAELDTAEDILDAARRAALIDDIRFARVVDVGEVDDAGYGYVVAEAPPGTPIDALAGRLDAASSRAVIGEAAAALEAARRRGVHHGALDPSLLTVSDEGTITIAGLGYLAVADHLNAEFDDPIEASVSRSRADARELARLHGYLASGTIPDEVMERSNAGEVMRSMTPWGDITLPVAPAPERAIPGWQRVRRAPAAATPPPPPTPTPTPPPPPTPTPTPPPPPTPTPTPTPTPPPPPPDTSSWTLRPGNSTDNTTADFADLLGDRSVSSPDTPPTHAASVDGGWKVLLPGTAGLRRGEATDAPVTEPAAAEPEPPAAEPEPAAAEPEPPAAEPEPPAAEPEPPAAEPEAEETPAEDEETSSSAKTKAAAVGASAVAAAAATATFAKEGAHKAREQAGRAYEASVKAADVSMKKLDTFVSKHDIHVPGELETEDNASLPFSQRRLDPGPFVIALILVVVVVATVLAILNLLTVGNDGASTDGVTTPAAVTTTAAAPDAAPAEEGAAAATEPAAGDVVVVPAIASIGVLDPQGDGAENPDLTPRATDGDPTTFWRSRSYVNPAYGMKAGLGLDLVLAEPALVTEVEITLMGNGGHVQLKADPADAVNGAVLAEADMGPTTVITLPEPTQLSHVVLWFTSLPVADSDGKNRLEVAEVVVR